MLECGMCPEVQRRLERVTSILRLPFLLYLSLIISLFVCIAGSISVSISVSLCASLCVRLPLCLSVLLVKRSNELVHTSRIRSAISAYLKNFSQSLSGSVKGHEDA